MGLHGECRQAHGLRRGVPVAIQLRPVKPRGNMLKMFAFVVYNDARLQQWYLTRSVILSVSFRWLSLEAPVWVCAVMSRVCRAAPGIGRFSMSSERCTEALQTASKVFPRTPGTELSDL